jgi:hypothetical protein
MINMRPIRQMPVAQAGFASAYAEPKRFRRTINRQAGTKLPWTRVIWPTARPERDRQWRPSTPSEDSRHFRLSSASTDLYAPN